MSYLMFALMLGAGLLLALTLVCCAYEYWARTDTKERYPPPGELIQLPYHTLHMVKKGQGGPTVVFESGCDGFGHMTWSLVQDALAEHATTVSYDRAGYLWSERGTNPKSGAAMAEELYLMLEAAGVSKPYILVGHSMAGLNLRSFVRQYPEDVAGVVLVDVSHPEQEQRFPPEMPKMTFPNWLISFALNFGLLRTVDKLLAPNDPSKDPAIQLALARTKQLVHKWVPAKLEELDNFSALAAEAGEITTFGDTPLVVLTGTDPARRAYVKDPAIRQAADEVWLEMQQEILKLSTNSRHVLVPQAGHDIQTDHPQTVIDAVFGLLGTQERAA